VLQPDPDGKVKIFKTGHVVVHLTNWKINIKNSFFLNHRL